MEGPDPRMSLPEYPRMPCLVTRASEWRLGPPEPREYTSGQRPPAGDYSRTELQQMVLRLSDEQIATLPQEKADQMMNIKRRIANGEEL